ncbi:MAG: DUF6580 family putative transport protein [bacterium]
MGNSSRGQTTLFLALTLIVLGAVLRFLPHPANVSPIAALALFAGVTLRRWTSFLVPLGAMVLSDAVIGFHPLIWATWGSFLLVGCIGIWVRRQTTFKRIVLGSLAASLLFSILTNWAVWAYTPLYAKTFSGLLACYVAAIPFFRNTLLGDLAYSGVFFGLYAGITVVLARRTQPTIPIAHNNDHSHP